MLEWLAIAVDAPLAVIAIIFYILHIIKTKDFRFDSFINNMSNSISNFYTVVLNLFTQKNKFALGVAGLLILHILTEIGNYIFPYITGRLDSLYFSLSSGTENLESAFDNLILLIESGRAPFFSINDFITSQPHSIFAYQIINMDSIFQIINLLLQYIFNLYFLIFILVMPGVIWWNMYKFSTDRKHRIHKIEINKYFIALFIISTVVVIFNSAFSIGYISNSEYNQFLTGSDLIKGVDIKTKALPIDVSFWPIILGIIISVIAFISGKTYRILNNGVAFLTLAAFCAYLYLFFMQINNYYFDIIHIGINEGLNVGSFILFHMILFYFITLLFYFMGIIFLLYELWFTKELSFSDIYQEGNLNSRLEEIKNR